MRSILATAALLALAACGASGSEAPAVEVEDVAVTLPAVPGRPGAAYFTLRTEHEEMRLVSISSPSADGVELHEMREENGVWRMAAMKEGRFPPSGEMKFEPGGRHAMLFGLDPKLKEGATIDLTFNFDPAPPVTVHAEVRRPGGHATH